MNLIDWGIFIGIVVIAIGIDYGFLRLRARRRPIPIITRYGADIIRVMSLILIGVAIWMFIAAQPLFNQEQYFPLTLSISGLVIAVIGMALQMFYRASSDSMPGVGPEAPLQSERAPQEEAIPRSPVTEIGRLTRILIILTYYIVFITLALYIWEIGVSSIGHWIIRFFISLVIAAVGVYIINRLIREN